MLSYMHSCNYTEMCILQQIFIGLKKHVYKKLYIGVCAISIHCFPITLGFSDVFEYTKVVIKTCGSKKDTTMAIKKKNQKIGWWPQHRKLNIEQCLNCAQQILTENILMILTELQSNLYINGSQGNLKMCPLSAVSLYMQVKIICTIH